MTKRLFENSNWLAAFRDACDRIRKENSLLVAAKGTCVGEPLVRAATRLFDLPLLLIRDSDKCRGLDRWLRFLVHASPNTCQDFFEAWISPSFLPPSDDELAIAPLRDQILCDSCETLYVLHIRPQGNMERLVRRRLTNPVPNQKTFLAAGSSLVPPQLVEEFLGLGAVSWTPSARWIKKVAASRPRDQPQIPSPALNKAAVPKVQQSFQFESWCYLTHCTRAFFGPWPDQSETEFYSELLQTEPIVPRTPMTSLARIVGQRMLRASGHGIRGSVPVVCFSESPLTELIKMRRFQPHRVRWDFEPYGICIRQSWLIKRGARPVIYGTDRDWEQLAAVDRPFFQRRTTSSRRRTGLLDWTREREWRLLGDLDLADLPTDEALLFVATALEAAQIARSSPWPVLTLENYLASSSCGS